MAIVESKLKVGTLTLGGTGTPLVGGVEFACQATNVRVTPTFTEDGDTIETLCGDKLAPSVTTQWALAGTSIQDFDSPDGFIAWSWDNNMTDQPFTWTPNAEGTSISGVVQVRALELGGDVAKRITSDFEWRCQGDPVATWPALAGATAGAPSEDTNAVAYDG
jgi:hypothetical protein